MGLRPISQLESVMKAIVAALAAVVVALGGVRADDKKVDPAKLIGKWELTKSTDPKAPKGATVEFTKDNKLVVVAEIEGTKREFTGTYKVDGDKLSVKLNFGDAKDNEDTDTIQSLTDEKLVLIDKDKQQNEFTKKK
jgi:uncharacterized protein (TIGR03066 family)